ncbi:MAG: hypothetical protein ACJAYE_003472 [Candidatus Azotimanducaceae bacterium]|jgi:hypothetical protein
MIDTFSMICEFSIGLAGFTGIVAIFSGDEIAVSPVIRFRVRNLLLCAFVPGFFGLSALGLIDFGVSTQLVAFYGSIAIFAFLSIWGPLSGLETRRFPEESKQELDKIIFVFTGSAIVFNLAVQAYGFLFSDGLGIFVGGLILLLFQGAVFFGALIFQLLDKRAGT